MMQNSSGHVEEGDNLYNAYELITNRQKL